MLAASVRWANISTTALDKDVKVMVGASDLWNDMVSLGKAIESKDTTQIGGAIGTLLTDWTAITGGCGKDATGCKLLDGLLKMAQVVAIDVAPCEAALGPALQDLVKATQDFESKQYKVAVGLFASGLDKLALAIGDDACGLKNVAALISKVSPKLASVVVKVEDSKAVSIMVGSANLYDELYTATKDLKNKDYGGFGLQMGR